MNLFKPNWKSDSIKKRLTWIRNAKLIDKNIQIIKDLIENDYNDDVREQALIKINDIDFFVSYIKENDLSSYGFKPQYFYIDKVKNNEVKVSKNSLSELKKMIDNEEKKELALKLIDDKEFLMQLIEDEVDVTNTKDHIYCNVNFICSKALYNCDFDYKIYRVIFDSFRVEEELREEIISGVSDFIKAEILESIEYDNEVFKIIKSDDGDNEFTNSLKKYFSNNESWEKLKDSIRKNSTEIINKSLENCVDKRWLLIENINDDNLLSELYQKEDNLYVRRRIIRKTNSDKLILNAALNDKSEYVRYLAVAKITNPNELEQVFNMEQNRIVLKYLSAQLSIIDKVKLTQILASQKDINKLELLVLIFQFEMLSLLQIANESENKAIVDLCYKSIIANAYTYSLEDKIKSFQNSSNNSFRKKLIDTMSTDDLKVLQSKNKNGELKSYIKQSIAKNIADQQEIGQGWMDMSR